MITEATVNDIIAAKTMPIEACATYVFDLGYYDYAWWAKLDDADCRIVTRFKKNTPLESAQSMPVEPATGILSDSIGFLPGRQAKTRKNPMQGAVREIVVTMETGGTLRILSNDIDAPAKEIADLYKRRWQIELFFLSLIHISEPTRLGMISYAVFCLKKKKKKNKKKNTKNKNKQQRKAKKTNHK